MHRKKQVIVIGILIACFVMVLTGCNINPANMKEISPDNGFWDRFFVYPLNVALEWFADLLFDNYGLAILVVTVIIRSLILPLTLKQLRSSKAMQAIQPDMQKIREKYKDNQQKMQEETMKLFQKHNVNPLSGCLPILVQMPILIAFYQAIMRNTHIREANFLWLELGQADPFYILPVLAAGGTYLQQKMMGVNMNPQMKMLMTIMPIMIFIISFSLPSALPLYWVYGNVFTIIQTYFLRDMYRASRGAATK